MPACVSGMSVLCLAHSPHPCKPVGGRIHQPPDCGGYYPKRPRKASCREFNRGSGTRSLPPLVLEWCGQSTRPAASAQADFSSHPAAPTSPASPRVPDWVALSLRTVSSGWRTFHPVHPTRAGARAGGRVATKSYRADITEPLLTAASQLTRASPAPRHATPQFCLRRAQLTACFVSSTFSVAGTWVIRGYVGKIAPTRGCHLPHRRN